MPLIVSPVRAGPHTQICALLCRPTCIRNGLRLSALGSLRHPEVLSWFCSYVKGSCLLCACAEKIDEKHDVTATFQVFRPEVASPAAPYSWTYRGEFPRTDNGMVAFALPSVDALYLRLLPPARAIRPPGASFDAIPVPCHRVHNCCSCAHACVRHVAVSLQAGAATVDYRTVPGLWVEAEVLSRSLHQWHIRLPPCNGHQQSRDVQFRPLGQLAPAKSMSDFRESFFGSRTASSLHLSTFVVSCRVSLVSRCEYRVSGLCDWRSCGCIPRRVQSSSQVARGSGC
jgi:hypothetical protein